MILSSFKSWLEETYFGPPSIKLTKAMLAEAMLVQNKNKLLTSKDNVLVPYGDWKATTQKGKHFSGFLRDAPIMHQYAMANPENLASTIIFVLLTVRADFMQVMQDFPTVMLKLFTKFGYRNEDMPLNGEELGDEITSMEKKLSQKANPAMLDKDGFLKGYSLKSTAFGFKLGEKKEAKQKNDIMYHGMSGVWTNRRRIFDAIKSLVDKLDTVGAFRQFLDVSGLAPVKAGFCVQIVMGKLGCIDMHNINLYSAYAKQYGKEDLYQALEPSGYSGKNRASIDNYLRVLEMLAEEGATTIKLWDIWTDYIAHNYTTLTGVSRYDDKGKFSGITADPQDKLVQKLYGLSNIPDRAGGKDTLFQTGASMAGGTGSRAHRNISQIRNTQYWWDILAAAQNPTDTPDEIRVKNPNALDLPHKALAYIVSEPEMAKEIGLPDEYIQQAADVLQYAGIMPGKNFSYRGQGVLFGPEALGASHNPVRTKDIKKKKEKSDRLPEPSLF